MGQVDAGDSLELSLFSTTLMLNWMVPITIFRLTQAITKHNTDKIQKKLMYFTKRKQFVRFSFQSTIKKFIYEMNAIAKNTVK